MARNGNGNGILKYDRRLKGIILGEKSRIIISDERILNNVEKALRIHKAGINVLINGSTGVGKEGLAKSLVFYGGRSNKPYKSVDMGAITETIAEAELFGHKAGAYTGAFIERKGLLRSCEGGTLFLDEISSVPMSIQRKLLRAIEFKEVQPLGSEYGVKKFDARFVFSSNKNLKEKIKEGSFREDFYFRIGQYEITLPPLEERKCDIPLLVNYFMERLEEKFHQNKSIDKKVLGALEDCNHSWPGNIRELENYVNRAYLITDGERITEEDIFGCFDKKPKTKISGKKHNFRNSENGEEFITFEEVKKRYFTELINGTKNNKSEAARQAGISRSKLITELKNHKIYIPGINYQGSLDKD